MKRNFTIEDAVAINGAVGYCDLHNFYDLVALTLNFDSRQLALGFRVQDGMQNVSSPKDLLIKFIGVNCLRISPRIISGMLRDVVEIGFKDADDADLDWLKPEKHSADGDHLIIRMSDDEVIRVHADSALLERGP